MNSPILDHWHFQYPPRPNQIKAFEWLYENRDKKYLILEAPVGSGKSNIGLTYSLFKEGTKGSSFILTPQRILQEQYIKSMFGEPKVNVATFYGKSNYKCHEGEFSCDVGSIVKQGKCENCPHKNAKSSTVSSPNAVLNYQLAITHFGYTSTFTKRNLMIMDECHTLESFLVEFDTTQVTEWRCKQYDIKFKKHTKLDEALSWLTSYYLPAIHEVLDDKSDECEAILDNTSKGNITAKQAKVLKEYQQLQEHCDILFELTTNKQINDEYVLVFDDTKFKFKRLTGAASFKRYIENTADQFLFMSSTILNKDGFCRDLGLDPSQAAFLSLQSDFDVENRPVYFTPAMKVNSGWKNDNIGKANLLEGIEQILNLHLNETGIIHTGNFALSTWLVENLNISHKIFHHNPNSGDDRNDVINAFLNFPKPAVLISPSITEGLDLKNDLGRFAIFAKVPYGFLGDQWIKRRMTMSSEWYRRQALINIIQGGGRVVRGTDDTGSVYILDECFNALYHQSKNMIPKWWQQSFIRV